MDEKTELQRELKQLREEYKYKDPDIWDEGSQRTRKIEWVIEHKLNTVDSTIFILYSETGSLRKLGKLLGCSHSTIRPEVNRIKAQILEELDKIDNKENF